MRREAVFRDTEKNMEIQLLEERGRLWERVSFWYLKDWACKKYQDAGTCQGSLPGCVQQQHPANPWKGSFKTSGDFTPQSREWV